MSTHQPPTSAERVLARHGRGPSALLQVVVLVVGAAAAVVEASILTAITATSNPVWVLPVIVAGFAIFGGFIATTAWSARAALAVGGPTSIGGGRYLAVVLLAGGLTTLALADERLERRIGAGLLVAAVALVVLSVLASMRRGLRVRRARRLSEGRRVVGVVTDDGLAEFPDSPNPKIATLTIRFRDDLGTERWITRRAVQVPGALIAAGTEVDVWFDPQDPADEHRILARHDNGTSRLIP